MLKFISEILLCFASCFSRLPAFDWFRVVIVGFMVRSDSLGITSIIRDLALKPSLYHCLEYFFHADSWEWDTIFETWVRTVASKAPPKHISGRVLLIGDGVKKQRTANTCHAQKRWYRNQRMLLSQILFMGIFSVQSVSW